MSLEVLPSVSRLSDRVIRILGQNPGKFTLQGTNTFLVGKRPPWILVDTGEGKAGYEVALEQALRQESQKEDGALGHLVSDVIITHRHGDHHGGLPSVLALLSRHRDSTPSYPPPRLHKFPLNHTLTFIRKSTSTGDTSLETTQSSLASKPEQYVASDKGTQTPHFHDLSDEQVFRTRDETSTLKVFHTPGHTSDSVSLLLVEENSLLTGDTVLGHGTAVFEDLALYMGSIHRMRSLLEASGGGMSVRIYPGHGPVVEDGLSLLDEYIKHRQDREDQIITLLKTNAPQAEQDNEPGWSIDGIVQTIYASYPASLWPAAAHGIALHLLKLEGEGSVWRNNASKDLEMRSDKWIFVSAPPRVKDERANA